tara:strand:+ start:19684 stop:19887 length:204 start_codon:yes stop_codon:yes gene_type:complete
MSEKNVCALANGMIASLELTDISSELKAALSKEWVSVRRRPWLYTGQELLVASKKTLSYILSEEEKL